MYIANHYVRISGQVLAKGDEIPEVPADMIGWLLSAGAIREAAPLDTEPHKDDIQAEELIPEEQEIDAMAGIVAPTEKKAKSERSKKTERRKK